MMFGPRIRVFARDASRLAGGSFRGFSLISILMLSVVSSAQNLVRQTNSKVEQFREARRGFERINQRLAQATLNAYWDYVDANGLPRTTANAATFVPARYERISELRYLQTNAAGLTAPGGGDLRGMAVFFQAPLGKVESAALSGMNSLLNTTGFFIERGAGLEAPPPTVSWPSKDRYRLYEMIEPAENLSIYSLTSGNADYRGTEWFSYPLARRAYSHRLADNIVALLFEAVFTDASRQPRASRVYSSEPRTTPVQPVQANNLPPHVRVTMIAVDEASAQRINNSGIVLTDATDDESLARLEAELVENRLGYHRFDSTVAIGPAQWVTQ